MTKLLFAFNIIQGTHITSSAKVELKLLQPMQSPQFAKPVRKRTPGDFQNISLLDCPSIEDIYTKELALSFVSFPTFTMLQRMIEKDDSVLRCIASCISI